MDIENGLIRAGTAKPNLTPGDVKENERAIIDLMGRSAKAEHDLVVFPELALTGYTCGDLFHQTVLYEAANASLQNLLEGSRGTHPVFFIGLPVPTQHHLMNCAAVLQNGKLLGLVPKTIIPNHGEFYEKRWFDSAVHSTQTEIQLCGNKVPFGRDLLFQANQNTQFTVGVEICEDLWAPSPPSTYLSLGGALVICNLSASTESIGKAEYRRMLIKQQSGRCMTGYVYSSSGPGESTTDVVFGGHSIIAENAAILSESTRFVSESELYSADLDLNFLASERYRSTSFSLEPLGEETVNKTEAFRRIPFDAKIECRTSEHLQRLVPSHPFVPSDASVRSDRCREIFAIQSQGLATRMESAGIPKAVLGLSGGLDSTLALLVTVEAFNRLGRSHSDIHCFTMPGFGTSERTKNNVWSLCKRLGVTLEEIDITESCRKHLQEIGHNLESSDTTYENAQARERTQILMDKANILDGLVVGTGDLSELALGWCTYNADHMAMYAVNSGVPKTLVGFLIQYVADTWEEQTVSATLLDILETPISPELLPPDSEGKISQKTEEVIGPFELHDFFLYYLIRCGYTPSKVRLFAQKAFRDAYKFEEIDNWLRVFIQRFFRHQFKRSCLPDGPKVGTLSLSPRGDWRMPSDASCAVWLTELDNSVERS